MEGEGSVCVSIKKHPNGKFGYLLDPEFFVYQHKNRIYILDLLKEMFGTGRIYPKSGNEDVLVFAIDSRKSLLERVIPFLDKYMPYSAKKADYDKFKSIIIALENKQHWTKKGMIEIVEIA
ncbi:MAG: LAGLIDADG family homing endonuclease, partial [Candidatus Omnitrophica bacterium]|nr:LAGLIDADG family homing endonuclease [Candidatus Omnitrophota bacterium]